MQTLPDDLFEKLTTIVASPGVPLDAPFMQKAASMGIPVIGDIELLAQEITAPVIAITGTNGKSTVTSLVGEMAKQAGLKTAVAGNIGEPVLDVLADGNDYDVWVLECSSFQLDLTYSLTPHAAVILNITEDHLDRHHLFAAYVQAKQRIFRHANTMIFNRDDQSTSPSIQYAHGAKVSFGTQPPHQEQWGLVMQDNRRFITYGFDQVIDVDAIKMKGKHNWMNAMAACALAQTLAIPFPVMAQVLTTFAGLNHRAQWVRTLNGVDWINDSKGTNVGATSAAIVGLGESSQGKIVLIAGGQGKGADFCELQQPVGHFVRSVVLIGEDADKIEQALTTIIETQKASSLEQAVIMAKANAQPGDIVLFSPACASFDMFVDFNQRGEVFIEAVNRL